MICWQGSSPKRKERRRNEPSNGPLGRLSRALGGGVEAADGSAFGACGRHSLPTLQPAAGMELPGVGGFIGRAVSLVRRLLGESELQVRRPGEGVCPARLGARTLSVEPAAS